VQRHLALWYWVSRCTQAIPHPHLRLRPPRHPSPRRLPSPRRPPAARPARTRRGPATPITRHRPIRSPPPPSSHGAAGSAAATAATTTASARSQPDVPPLSEVPPSSDMPCPRTTCLASSEMATFERRAQPSNDVPHLRAACPALERRASPHNWGPTVRRR